MQRVNPNEDDNVNFIIIDNDRNIRLFPEEIWIEVFWYLDDPSLFFLSYTTTFFNDKVKHFKTHISSSYSRTRIKNLLKTSLRLGYTLYVSFLIEKHIKVVRANVRSLCIIATQRNHFELLKVILLEYREGEDKYDKEEKSFTILDSISLEAAAEGHIHILEWLRDEHDYSFNEDTYDAAAWGGQIPSLKWLKENGVPYRFNLCEKTIVFHHLDTLKYLKEAGYPCDLNECASIAAEEGAIEILDYLKNEGCKFTSSILAVAAWRGQFDTIIWLREHGCPWDYHVTTYIAADSPFPTLQWLIEHGCPFDKKYCLKQAKERGEKDFIEWIKEERYLS